MNSPQNLSFPNDNIKFQETQPNEFRSNRLESSPKKPEEPTHQLLNSQNTTQFQFPQLEKSKSEKDEKQKVTKNETTKSKMDDLFAKILN